MLFVCATLSLLNGPAYLIVLYNVDTYVINTNLTRKLRVFYQCWNTKC